MAGEPSDDKTPSTARIFIEGDYPTFADAAMDFPAADVIGHRLRIEAHGKKTTAVVLPWCAPQRTTKFKLTAGMFENSYLVFNDEALRHAEAIAEYYLTDLADVLALMLPPAPAKKSALSENAEPRESSSAGAINEQQKQIIAAILDTPPEIFSEHLLWGVTGSGKTRIYEHLIRAASERGEQTLLLVPEIALSGQLMEVITSRFPGETVLYHSGLSDTERLLSYRRFITGTARIAVGTRSAVFLPAKNLGQIIIDEEHDTSFKDQRRIRFDTRTVARLRIENAGNAGRLRLILGSATPSLESLGRAKSGAAKLHRLRQRATGQNMPDVFIPEYKFQHGIISPFLAEKMREHLTAGNQVLLLMNRRGHSTHVHCPVCDAQSVDGRSVSGYAECPRCAVALTYHKEGTLRCHCCGYREDYRPLCPKDGAERRLSGRGIQRVEEILENQFGDYEYARLDRDTARKKGFTAEVLSEMRSGKIRILIGTQMIAKGFDIEGITLVGVLAIDQTLASPDFRAGESAWQLLSQVLGRSGRHRPGEVVIQTMSPRHAAVRAAAEHDADTFYAAEANFRQLTQYPPFGALARLILSADNEAVLFKSAEKLAAEIEPKNSADLFGGNEAGTVEILGPAVPGVSKIEGLYRVHFLIKATTFAYLHAHLKKIRPLMDRLERQVPGLTAILDIDPRETG